MFSNKTSYIKLSIIVFIQFILFASSFAQNWTGNVNSDWNNSANWSSWPLNGSDILIDPINYTGVAAAPVLSVNSVFNPGGIIIQNGASVTIGANLTATKRIELFNNGTLLTINSGTVFAAGSGSQGRFIVSDGAQVTLNNGGVKANQHVIVELGASFMLNNGIVNPLQTLAIGDGNASGSSLFKMNGGNVVLGQGMDFENEAGLYYPTFEMNAGTLTVGTDVSWLGVTPGTGTPRFIMNGGSGTIGGSVFNDPATTVDLYMRIGGNSNLTVNGAITLINPTDSVIQSGASMLTLSNTNVISNPGVWHSTGGTILLNGSTSLQGTGSYRFNNVIINPAKVLSHINPATITVIGDFTNSGTFNAGSNTVDFSGSVPQNINGSSATAFKGMILNNSSSAGLTLNKDITVTGSLLLNNGKLNSSSGNLITLTDDATANSGSNASFVNGPIRKTGNDAFVFPIGKNNLWRRAAITAPASVNSEFVAEYFSNSYSSITPVNSPLQSVSNIEYWKIDRLISSDTVNVTLHWENALSSAISNCSQLSIGNWNGTSWINVPSTNTGSCTGSGTGMIQSNAALNAFGYFTFGFYGNVYSQNLTICNGDSITVGSNSYSVSGTYVDVLTAANLQDSIVSTQLYVLPQIVNNQNVNLCFGDKYIIGPKIYSVAGNYSDTLVSAAGCDSIVNTVLTFKNPIDVSVTQNIITLTPLNTNAGSYQWVDCNNNYAILIGETAQSFTAVQNGDYAVIITENSCADTSACFTINSVGIAKHHGKSGFEAYPNPGSGHITIKTESIEKGTLKLYDATGKLIQSKAITGQNHLLEYSNEPEGVYYLELITETGTLRKKLIKL